MTLSRIQEGAGFHFPIDLGEHGLNRTEQVPIVTRILRILNNLMLIVTVQEAAATWSISQSIFGQGI